MGGLSGCTENPMKMSMRFVSSGGADSGWQAVGSAASGNYCTCIPWSMGTYTVTVGGLAISVVISE
jgi:hypothetical protein